MTVGEGSPISVPSGNNILQDFSDATAGRSQQLYHCMGATDASGVTYVLGRDAGNSIPAVKVNPFDIDFNITINKPTIFAGIAQLDVRHHAQGGPGQATLVTFKVYHYDGSTETEIGTVVTTTIDNGADQQLKMEFDITRTLFGIGDVLRLNAVDASGSDGRIYFDPFVAGDEMKLWMPVVNLE